MELRLCRLKQLKLEWSVFLSGPELFVCHFTPVTSTGIEEAALLVVLL